MESQFQKHGGTFVDGPSRFVESIQKCFGDDFDPDAVFLEESWKVSIPAAAESLHSRRQNRSHRERQSRDFRELGSLGSLFVMENYDCAAESLLADRASRIAREYAPVCMGGHVATTAASIGDLHESWISANAEHPTEPWDEMTVKRAHTLLATTNACTIEQIRSAYRRKVSEWHPDRLQHASDRARECATQQMAAINEAYRLLRTTLLEDVTGSPPERKRDYSHQQT
jgi:DnaJ-domain-containing protein 1